MSFWYRGQIQHSDEISLPISALAWQRGDGLFETLRVVDGTPYFLRRHLDRLQGSLQRCGFPSLDLDSVASAAIDLAASGSRQQLERMRITSYRDGELIITLTPSPSVVGAQNFMMSRNPMSNDSLLSGNKATSYFEFMQQRSLAEGAGFTDVILVNPHNIITETSLANILIEIDGSVRTPTLHSGALPGITRSLILEWSPEIVEMDTHADELASITAAASISSVFGVVPIASIENRTLIDSGNISNIAKVFEERALMNPSY
jgi:branched-chain amino acid aminotransferase